MCWSKKEKRRSELSAASHHICWTSQRRHKRHHNIRDRQLLSESWWGLWKLLPGQWHISASPCLCFVKLWPQSAWWRGREGPNYSSKGGCGRLMLETSSFLGRISWRIWFKHLCKWAFWHLFNALHSLVNSLVANLSSGHPAKKTTIKKQQNKKNSKWITIPSCTWRREQITPFHIETWG